MLGTLLSCNMLAVRC